MKLNPKVLKVAVVSGLAYAAYRLTKGDSPVKAAEEVVKAPVEVAEEVVEAVAKPVKKVVKEDEKVVTDNKPKKKKSSKKPKFVKGSPEAKAHMAKLRAARKKKS